MNRSSVPKRVVGLARSAWNYPRKPLGMGTALKRKPFKSGPVSLNRGNLQRQSTPLQRLVAIPKRSAKRTAAQLAWNNITTAKIAAGGCCQRCGVVDKPEHRLHAHHFLPRGRGGKDTLDNHVLLCPACHRFVHENPAAATAAGLLMPSRREVAAVNDKAPSQRVA